eukprot:TRINITY_DN1233_c0_g2_i1.p1 TRINITY_DN1233_c0_g2~~TRINITY_DN1233_c0_g2_i1.p1  ORF type:complete len:280 (+),score=38.97 TRINITY_DN1233_c0_g2_i1:32-871(+)
MQRLLLSCCVLITLCVAVYGQGFTIGPSTNPAPVTSASISRITAIADDMYQRWYQLDAACDPRAVFAVAYLFMTANAKKLVQNLYFDDGNKMVDFISTFAGRYLAAYTAWDNGQYNNVSLPWAVYYNFLDSKRSDVTQDITIGMNAHINYDLGIAAYQQGYASSRWRNDYYRVNDLMAQVDTNVTLALGRYDPQFYNTDWVSQTYFQASIDFVTSWRSNAYSQALAYQAALTPLGVKVLQATYEAAAATTGQSIAIPYLYRTNTTRVAYCQANHYPLVV